MSDLSDTTKRLNEIATELGNDEITDERAEALAREAADLVGEAGAAIERALRDASADEG